MSAESRNSFEPTAQDERIAEFVATVFDYIEPRYYEPVGEEDVSMPPVQSTKVVQFRPWIPKNDGGHPRE